MRNLATPVSCAPPGPSLIVWLVAPTFTPAHVMAFSYSTPLLLPLTPPHCHHTAAAAAAAKNNNNNNNNNACAALNMVCTRWVWMTRQPWRHPTGPDELRCPITYEMMTDPVITVDGHTYERSSITEWFLNHNTYVRPWNHRRGERSSSGDDDGACVCVCARGGGG